MIAGLLVCTVYTMFILYVFLGYVWLRMIISGHTSELFNRSNLSCDLCDSRSFCTVGLRSSATPGAMGDPV